MYQFFEQTLDLCICIIFPGVFLNNEKMLKINKMVYFIYRINIKLVLSGQTSKHDSKTTNN